MTHFVEVDGRRVAYDVWGDRHGLPVISLHGTPGSRLNRYPDNAALATSGAMVITYDRAGYGRSDRNPGRAIVDCVRDVEAIAEDLGIDRFAVTGRSGGGPHSLAVAARLGQRVLLARCVVGVAPFDAEGLDWIADTDPENVKEHNWTLAGETILHEELTREATDILERITVDPAKFLDNFELSEADRSALMHPLRRQVLAEMLPEAFANGVWGWVDDDLAFVKPWGFDLAEISVPVEIWYGETDVLSPPAHSRWLAEHVPGAVAHVDRAAGHMDDFDHAVEAMTELVAAAKARL